MMKSGIYLAMMSLPTRERGLKRTIVRVTASSTESLPAWERQCGQNPLWMILTLAEWMRRCLFQMGGFSFKGHGSVSLPLNIVYLTFKGRY